MTSKSVPFLYLYLWTLLCLRSTPSLNLFVSFFLLIFLKLNLPESPSKTALVSYPRGCICRALTVSYSKTFRRQRSPIWTGCRTCCIGFNGHLHKHDDRFARVPDRELGREPGEVKYSSIWSFKISEGTEVTEFIGHSTRRGIFLPY